MKYSRWLIFIFLIQISIGCSSEYTYEDINLSEDFGLEVIKLDSGKVRLLLPDGKPFTGVLHQTAEDTSQDSLIFGKYGSPKNGKWKLYDRYDLVETGYYSNGKKVGEWKSFQDGRLTQKGFYLNGVKDSIWVYKNRSGISMQGNYENGKKQGEWIIEKDSAEWDIKETGKYVDGVKQGEWKITKSSSMHVVTIEDTKTYIDGVSKEEMIRNEIKKSIRNKDYYGKYYVRQNYQMLQVEIENEDRFWSSLQSQFHRGSSETWGDYQLSESNFELITFDSGNKCYKFELNADDGHLTLGRYSSMCYEWKRDDMYIKKSDGTTYYGMTEYN